MISLISMMIAYTFVNYKLKDQNGSKNAHKVPLLNIYIYCSIFDRTLVSLIQYVLFVLKIVTMHEENGDKQN